MTSRLEFSIDINADKEKIWEALWTDQNYRDWCGVFEAGSHYFIKSWKKGNEIMFLASNQNGIYSVIEKYVPNEIIQFKHIGTVNEGEKQAIDDNSKIWTGALETYSLIKSFDFFTLLVEIDVLNEHVDFMSITFPIALKKIKTKSELLAK